MEQDKPAHPHCSVRTAWTLWFGTPSLGRRDWGVDIFLLITNTVGLQGTRQQPPVEGRPSYTKPCPSVPGNCFSILVVCLIRHFYSVLSTPFLYLCLLYFPLSLSGLSIVVYLVLCLVFFFAIPIISLFVWDKASFTLPLFHFFQGLIQWTNQSTNQTKPPLPVGRQSNERHNRVCATHSKTLPEMPGPGQCITTF